MEQRTKKRFLSNPKKAQSNKHSQRLMLTTSIFSLTDSRKPFITKKETKSRHFWGHQPSPLQKSKKFRYNKFRLKVVLVLALSSHLRSSSLPKYKLRKWLSETLPKSPRALLEPFSKNHRKKHPKVHSKEAQSHQKQDRDSDRSHRPNSRILQIKFSPVVHCSNHLLRLEFKSRKRRN